MKESTVINYSTFFCQEEMFKMYAVLVKSCERDDQSLEPKLSVLRPLMIQALTPIIEKTVHYLSKI